MLECGDSQDLKLPWWGRRVILIQCHLAHPSVWPWNPGICSLLLLGCVRWQAKTLMGGPWSTLRTRSTALCCAAFRGHVRVPHVFLRKPSRTRGGEAKSWPRPLSLLRWPRAVVATAWARGTCWGPLCRPPPEPPVWPSAKKEQTLLPGSRFTESHCQIACDCGGTSQRSKPPDGP